MVEGARPTGGCGAMERSDPGHDLPTPARCISLYEENTPLRDTAVPRKLP